MGTLELLRVETLAEEKSGGDANGEVGQKEKPLGTTGSGRVYFSFYQ